MQVCTRAHPRSEGRVWQVAKRQAHRIRAAPAALDSEGPSSANSNACPDLKPRQSAILPRLSTPVAAINMTPRFFSLDRISSSASSLWWTIRVPYVDWSGRANLGRCLEGLGKPGHFFGISSFARHPDSGAPSECSIQFGYARPLGLKFCFR